MIRSFSIILLNLMLAVLLQSLASGTDLAVTGKTSAAVAPANVLSAESFRRHVDKFNREDEELYTNNIPNAQAWDFLKANIPLFECPDEDIERTYYFRWWTYRKHIKQTPDGWVITEFLPKVSWSAKHNTICCPAGHHFYEGRWLRDQKYLDDYATFWFQRGGSPRHYSFWAADAIYGYYLARHNAGLVTGLLPDLVKNYEAWEHERQLKDGMFWQIDDRDGMECSIGKSGKRATINSYMYGDARAIAAIAVLAGNKALEAEYNGKADRLRSLVQQKLWNENALFFETQKRSRWEDVVPQRSSDKSVPRYNWGFAKDMDRTQWVEYAFAAPVRVEASEVYWFVDQGAADLPQSWRLLYRQGESWIPVKNPVVDPVKADVFNAMKFEPVETTGLRLEASLQPKKSGGIIEWRVLSGGQNVAPKAKADGSVPNGGRWGNTEKALNDGENPDTNSVLVNVRELHGYTPWYFNLPEGGKGYERAWKQLMDTNGFYALFGSTTAEQRHPEFIISYKGHGCQWNGPSWPFSSAVTLTAMANVLNNYKQDAISKSDYLDILKVYAHSHRRTLKDGRVVPWIDEDIDPFTGEWIARNRCEEHNAELVKKGETDKVLRERGKDYNHSTYCDLVITGLAGLRPRTDDVVEVNPLVPDGKWDFFCLDNVAYHGHTLTILWDKTGEKYKKGKGLRVYSDGKEIAMAKTLSRVTGQLP